MNAAYIIMTILVLSLMVANFFNIFLIIKNIKLNIICILFYTIITKNLKYF